MEVDDLNIVLLDLKYCERCGSLWLRPRGSDEVLCASCATQITKLRVGWGEKNMPLVLRTTIRADGESREVVVICGEGGNA
ncbi:MAG TPA: hypothetical protein VEI26_14910 [Terriglobales bacterium]|nr:hypothetical protein [Terriglobales bacterium]